MSFEQLAVNNPTVVRLYHQLQKENGEDRKYKGLYQTYSTIYAEEGIFGLFFKGSRMLAIFF
jgi:hypothetical protein